MAKPTEVTTKPVRLSYTKDLFEARAQDPKKPEDKKYSVQLLLPPDFDLTPIRTAIKAAMTEKFGDKAAAMLAATKDPAKNKMAPWGNPIRKMEEKQDAETGEFEPGMMAGGHFISAKNKYQPTVVDRQAKRITDPEQIPPGSWGHVHLNAYAWLNNGLWGVSLSLEAVQFVRADERLDGRKAATDMFRPLEGETPPAAAGEATSDQDALFG